MEIKDRREYQRTELNGYTNIHPVNNPKLSYNVLLLNVGGGGISFKCEEKLAIGEKLLLNIPSMPIYFYIIWNQGDTYGAMFVNPLGTELEMVINSIVN